MNLHLFSAYAPLTNKKTMWKLLSLLHAWAMLLLQLVENCWHGGILQAASHLNLNPHPQTDSANYLPSSST